MPQEHDRDSSKEPTSDSPVQSDKVSLVTTRLLVVTFNSSQVTESWRPHTQGFYPLV